MTLKAVFLAGVLVMLLALAWRLGASGAVEQWLYPPPVTSKPIVFDNGTVRQMPAPASAPTLVEHATAPGMARKCLSVGQQAGKPGSRVTYTDSVCPPGTQQMTIGGTVTVLEGAGGTRPAAAASQVPGKRRKTVLEALDDNPNLKLGEKRIERAVNP